MVTVRKRTGKLHRRRGGSIEGGSSVLSFGGNGSGSIGHKIYCVFRFLVLSSVIPALFVIRFTSRKNRYERSRHIDQSSNISLVVDNTTTSSTFVVSTVNNSNPTKLSNSTSIEHIHENDSFGDENNQLLKVQKHNLTATNDDDDDTIVFENYDSGKQLDNVSMIVENLSGYHSNKSSLEEFAENSKKFKAFVQKLLIQSIKSSLDDSDIINGTDWNGTSSSSSSSVTNPESQNNFLVHTSTSIGDRYYRTYSDIVELDHCDINTILTNDRYWNQFMKVSTPFLSREFVMESLQHRIKQDQFVDVLQNERVTELTLQSVQQEFTLQLLEQYAQIHQMCNYTRYRPTVSDHNEEGKMLEQHSSSHITVGHDSSRRLVYIIIAYHDVHHLVKLVDAIYSKQHYIIIHLERACTKQFKEDVYARIVSKYAVTLTPNDSSGSSSEINSIITNNVVVVQFGTVVYKTDSVSMINLRILRWITIDLQLRYDYVITMDGSSYPIQSTASLLDILPQSNVWLGELTHQGKRLNGPSSASHLLSHKRLIFTNTASTASQFTSPQESEEINIRTTSVSKFTIKLPMNTWESLLSLSLRFSAQDSDKMDDEPLVSSLLSDHIRKFTHTYKTTSGNQGAFSRSVVSQLLNSQTVMELFALSKYGCCCCLEERTWIAALGIIDAENGFDVDEADSGMPNKRRLVDDALTHTSTFQVWGGKSNGQCTSSMKNAFLSLNSTICYRSEDPFRAVKPVNNGTEIISEKSKNNMYFYGNQTWDMLIDAHKRTVLLARKFESSETSSTELVYSSEELRTKIKINFLVTNN